MGYRHRQADHGFRYIGLERDRLVAKLGQCKYKLSTGRQCDQPAITHNLCMRHAKVNVPLIKKRELDRKNQHRKRGTFYEPLLTKEEVELLPAMTLGSVDEELSLARVMLRREQEVLFQLESTKTVGGKLINGTLHGGKVIETVHRTTDLQSRVDKWVRTIASLERVRAELAGKLPPPPATPAPIHIHFDKALGDSDE